MQPTFPSSAVSGAIGDLWRSRVFQHNAPLLLIGVERKRMDELRARDRSDEGYEFSYQGSSRYENPVNECLNNWFVHNTHPSHSIPELLTMGAGLCTTNPSACSTVLSHTCWFTQAAPAIPLIAVLWYRWLSPRTA